MDFREQVAVWPVAVLMLVMGVASPLWIRAIDGAVVKLASPPAPSWACGETVMQVPQVYRILPELLLTITGVLIMLIEPVMPPGMTRKPIGFLAIGGVLAR